MYTCLILQISSNLDPYLASLISLIKSWLECFHIHEIQSLQASTCFMNVLKFFGVLIEDGFKCLVVYLHSYYKCENHFSHSGRKPFSLQYIWLLTLYYFNQILSTMKMKVIGFTIIRGNYTVIYYEKKTKMLMELVPEILFMLIIQSF